MADNEIKQRVTIEGVQQAASDLNRIAEAEGKVVRQVDKATAASAKAADVAQRRGRSEERLKDKLHQLTLVEARHQQRVNRGEHVTESDIHASGRRERMIDRLGARLGIYARANDHATATVRKYSSAAHDATAQGAKLESGFTSLTGGAKALVGGLAGAGGLLAVLGQLRKEYANIVELQEKAFRSQISLASAQRTLKLNLPGASDKQVKHVISEGQRIAHKYNIPEAQVDVALGSSISATGGNVPLAISLTEMASQIRPDKPEMLPEIAGALGDIGNAIGNHKPLIDEGYLLRVAGQARVADVAAQYKSIPVAITGLRAAGFNEAEAGAFFGALTNQMADVTGDIGGTAAVSVATQLQQFFKERGRPERGAAAIRALQHAPALAKQLFEHFSVDTKAAGPVRDLLTDANSPIAQKFRNFVSQYHGEKGYRQVAIDKLKQLKSGPVEATARLNRTYKSSLDELYNSNFTGAKAGVTRAHMADLLKAAGAPDLATKIKSAEFEYDTKLGSQGVIKAAKGIIQERIDALTATSELVTPSPFAAAFATGVVTPMKVSRTPTKRDLQSAAALKGVITTADKLLAEQEDATASRTSSAATPEAKQEASPTASVPVPAAPAESSESAPPPAAPLKPASASQATTGNILAPNRAAPTKPGVDPYMARALDEGAAAFDGDPDLNAALNAAAANGGGHPVVVHQTVIHRMINTRKNPYTSDLNRREPIR